MTRGQLLARLDPTFAVADLAALAPPGSTLEAEVARLQAEVDGKPFDYSGLDPSWTLQASIFERRKAVYDAKMENFDRQRDELTSVISRVAIRRRRLSRAAHGRGILDRADAEEARGEPVGKPPQYAPRRGQSRRNGARAQQRRADRRGSQAPAGGGRRRARRLHSGLASETSRRASPRRVARLSDARELLNKASFASSSSS